MEEKEIVEAEANILAIAVTKLDRFDGKSLQDICWDYGLRYFVFFSAIYTIWNMIRVIWTVESSNIVFVTQSC